MVSHKRGWEADRQACGKQQEEAGGQGNKVGVGGTESFWRSQIAPKQFGMFWIGVNQAELNFAQFRSPRIETEPNFISLHTPRQETGIIQDRKSLLRM